MAIFLIRHGETLGNAARIVQRPEIPLSPRGVAQAERLAQRLERAGIARMLASDLTRAVMTAEHLRQVTGLPIELDPLLQERNFGDVRGTPYADLGFDLFAPDYAPPGGETWEVFHSRVDRAWARVQEAAAATDGHLAVVTHGLVCRSLAARHLVLPAGRDRARALGEHRAHHRGGPGPVARLAAQLHRPSGRSRPRAPSRIRPRLTLLAGDRSSAGGAGCRGGRPMYHNIVLRTGKGDTERAIMLPEVATMRRASDPLLCPPK